ncbi:MAG: tRNA adenosine deaminase-associated protein [Jatrophihabitans sp.]|uniref:tRNA adenosine deaminase-associated protein n=1 Tax=Jatrophihabitans sp. TaxID=1932789 RepID=UPI003F7E9609
MAAFAAVLTRAGGRWRAQEESVDDCESVAELGELLAEHDGTVRLLLIEQDDEFAAIVRLDDEVRVFLTDGHAADSYPLAAMLAEDLEPAVASRRGAAVDDEDDDEDEVPPLHESVPFGDAAVVEDLGTDPGDLIDMSVHPGTLPIDVLVAVCEKAGCADLLDDLRG